MGDGVVGGALLGAQGAAGPRLARAGTHTLVSSTVQYSTVQYSTVQQGAGPCLARAGTHTLVSRLPRASADRELKCMDSVELARLEFFTFQITFRNFIVCSLSHHHAYVPLHCITVMIRVH